jgi:hypothetical protein
VFRSIIFQKGHFGNSDVRPGAKKHITLCHVVHFTVILFLLGSKLALQYVATSYEVGDT